MSRATTQGVQVEVEPTFHRERSDPARQHWFFSYHVLITNTGTQTVRLRRRHWDTRS